MRAIRYAHLRIWRTDADGQLGSRSNQSPELLQITGALTTDGNVGKGNGTSLQQVCATHDAAPMNTWDRKPGQQEHDHIVEATWIIPDGETLICRKYRNFVRRTCASREFSGDVEQQRKHAVVKNGTASTICGGYFCTQPLETGDDIKYNFKHGK